MVLSLTQVGADKDQLVVSLAALILADSKAEISAESIQAVVSSSGNSVPAYYTSLFATFIEKAGGVDKFLAGPSSGGGGGGAAAPAAAAGAPAAAAKAAAPVEEEADALDGGMDMFGGGGEKTGDY